jgi:hypothetical protein
MHRHRSLLHRRAKRREQLGLLGTSRSTSCFASGVPSLFGDHPDPETPARQHHATGRTRRRMARSRGADAAGASTTGPRGAIRCGARSANGAAAWPGTTRSPGATRAPPIRIWSTSSRDARSGIADPFNGHIDEFRLAHVQRTDGWIATTWNNQTRIRRRRPPGKAVPPRNGGRSASVRSASHQWCRKAW